MAREKTILPLPGKKETLCFLRSDANNSRTGSRLAMEKEPLDQPPSRSDHSDAGPLATIGPHQPLDQPTVVPHSPRTQAKRA